MKATLLSRRQFSGLLAAAPAVLKGQLTGSDAAHVKIDTDRIIGQIDPKIYGNFTEHLGRCIEGGIFEEGSPLSDAEGFRRDVLEAVRNLHVTLLRYPGGNFASNYHWRDGIGPRDSRPVRADPVWYVYEPNDVGTDEFMVLCRLLDTEPYLCVNMGNGTPDEAAAWVEYCNGPVTSTFGAL